MKTQYLRLIISTAFAIQLGLLNPIYCQNSSIVYFSESAYSSDSLDNFNDEIKYYKFKEFPKLKYTKPQINNWTNSLEEIYIIPENQKHIVVGYKNKQVIYIRLITEPFTFTKEFYSILNDTIKIEISGLTVPAPNYALYIYQKNLLCEYIQYLKCASQQDNESKFNFCPYKKEEIKYHEATNIPKIIKTFFVNKFSEIEKDFAIEYDKDGKQINKTIVN
ncbi:MAG: hypothetical protein PHE33_06930 [Bacteroidales bacterium]|nr:hypothetical protein [Bacteroidales bacterium]